MYLQLRDGFYPLIYGGLQSSLYISEAPVYSEAFSPMPLLPRRGCARLNSEHRGITDTEVPQPVPSSTCRQLASINMTGQYHYGRDGSTVSNFRSCEIPQISRRHFISWVRNSPVPAELHKQCACLRGPAKFLPPRAKGDPPGNHGINLAGSQECGLQVLALTTDSNLAKTSPSTTT
jgi:hypothetical protein